MKFIDLKNCSFSTLNDAPINFKDIHLHILSSYYSLYFKFYERPKR